MCSFKRRAGRRSDLSLLDGLTAAGLFTIGFVGLASGLVAKAEAFLLPVKIEVSWTGREGPETSSPLP